MSQYDIKFRETRTYVIRIDGPIDADAIDEATEMVDNDECDYIDEIGPLHVASITGVREDNDE